MFDLIGDIHGHADKLEELLVKLDYRKNSDSYAHPERKVLFVGDYIDRGPKIPETLAIVRSMVESGNAIALMGNHEYNALCFHYRDHNSGGHLRPHYIKNIVQHYETLRQFHNRQREYEDNLEWFKTLPLFYETDTFRAVHACWDKNHIDFLRKTLHENKLTDELIRRSVDREDPLYNSIDETLKGKEITLPDGQTFRDVQGTERTDIRIKWWENPENMTYRSISVQPINHLPDRKINLGDLSSSSWYRETKKPVFFGHYWLKGDPIFYRPNICCLDYSVAKGGKLVAYSFDGEDKLKSDKLRYV
ncbi:MAG: phosphoesterase [Saprospirales bacterium]|nr:MAG: phosphoesterase [Saprospirales bacterium]